jgi:hypothetical protein
VEEVCFERAQARPGTAGEPKQFGGDGKAKSMAGGAAKAYLLEREAHWSPKTREMHANSLHHLQDHFGKLLLDEIRAEDSSRYQRDRQKEGASNRSINTEVNLVRLSASQGETLEWHCGRREHAEGAR